MKPDLISVVEAAYAIDQPEEGWLRGMLSAARGTMDDGLGVMAFTYDASNPAAFHFNTFLVEGAPEGIEALARQGIPAADPDYIRRSFLALPCGTASDTPGWRAQPRVDDVVATEVQDMLAINGMNPGGLGCVVAAFLSKPTKLGSRRRKILEKISCHMAAGYRLRLALAGNPQVAGAAEAVLDHDGRIHHAQGDAQSRASRDRLTESALSMRRARRRLRESSPEQAVEEWKGLIAARWTLVDVCEADGRRVLVARENEPRGRGAVALTDRERQVVALAALGQHNKLIGYNLGISHSTVRVLIARASAKLGLRSRTELINHHFRVSEGSFAQLQHCRDE